MKRVGRIRTGGQILYIPQELIVPNRAQPRKLFEADKLRELTESVKANGILQPLTVRAGEDGYYELISGERRLRAARDAGLKEIPCIFIMADDRTSAVFALIENLQRADLNCFEEAQALDVLLNAFNLSREQLAEKTGLSLPAISNKLRLLKLEPPIREKITAAGLGERHARTLLRLASVSERARAADYIINNNLSAAAAEDYIAKLSALPAVLHQVIPDKQPKKIFKDLRIFVNTINHAVDTMCRAGIQAVSEKNETEEYIQYTVRIPK